MALPTPWGWGQGRSQDSKHNSGICLPLPKLAYGCQPPLSMARLPVSPQSSHSAQDFGLGGLGGSESSIPKSFVLVQASAILERTLESGTGDRTFGLSAFPGSIGGLGQVTPSLGASVSYL